MSESIFTNDTDLFKSSEISNQVKACFVSIMLGGGVKIRKSENHPPMVQALVPISNGTMQGVTFVPKAPVSKSAYQTYKIGATSKFVDSVDRIFNGSMNLQEVVAACYEECLIRFGKADVSKFIETNPNSNVLNMQEKVKQVVVDLAGLQEYSIQVPNDMVDKLVESLIAEYGKKKQITSGQQTASVQA